MSSLEPDQTTKVTPYGTSSRPRLRPFTLRFIDDEVEAGYQRHYVAGIMGTTRFGLALTILLFAAFGVLDPHLAPPEVVTEAWWLRGTMAVVLLGTFAASWTPFFIRHQQNLMLAAVLVTGVSLGILYALLAEVVEYQHVIGMVLLVIGSYAVLGLQFHYTVIVGVAILLIYWFTDVFFRQDPWATGAFNLLMVGSTVLITAVGAYAAHQSRRLAYYHYLQVEQEREASRQIALHDPLTGLPNRRLLTENLAQAIARNERYKTMAAVLFIDLDDFKPINDRHGHVFGDRFLKAVGERLLESVRSTDTVSRLGGDEFVVLLEDLQDEAGAECLRRRVQEAFEAHIVIDGIHVQAKLSIGCAMHPRDAQDPRRLLELADQRMYETKRLRKAGRS